MKNYFIIHLTDIYSAKLDEERLLMSVAELKHVRDCLKFQLPFQDRGTLKYICVNF